MSTVYWITGLSGAGKTTIGKLFYEKIRGKCPNTVFLDGDMLRKVFGDDLGYTKEDRRKCAMRYSGLCAMLQEQNIHNYKEIYVKVSMDTLKKRDQKGLYSDITEEKQKEVVGVHMDLEEPMYPDLILENDGEKTPEEQVRRICQLI